MLFGHGDDYFSTSGELVANYSSNVWYGARQDVLRDHLYATFQRLSRYPEPDAASLKQALAGCYGLSESQVLVTNGSITAFYLIAQAWAGASSAIFIPSFAEYEDACTLYKHQIRYIRNEFPLSSVAFAKEELCWICNPNNPDGRLWPADDIRTLLAAYPDTLFILDQAYAEFIAEETVSPAELAHYPNLILIRSISKVHKIPGLRIGYILASPALISRIQAYLIPWSVNSLAVETGKYVLQHPEQFELPLARWRKDTMALMQALAEIPDLEVLPSCTTFFLVRLKRGTAAALKQYLLEEHRILIRDASNFRGLTPAYFRLSTQTPEQNALLVQAIRQWLETF